MSITQIQNKPAIIIKTWIGNRNGTILFAIPNHIAKEYNLEKPTYLILEKRSKGLFFRKLEI